MTTRCGYHTKICGMAHINPNVVIEHPNELAVCDRHYEAKRRKSPAAEWPMSSTVLLLPGVYMDTSTADDANGVGVFTQPSTTTDNGRLDGGDNARHHDGDQYTRPKSRAGRAWNGAKRRIAAEAKAMKSALIANLQDAVSQEGPVIREALEALTAPVLGMVGEGTKTRAKRAASVWQRPRAIMRRSAAFNAKMIQGNLGDDVKAQYGLEECKCVACFLHVYVPSIQ
jgi:hypothetical protein